jgi:Homeodomain-like domain
MFNESPHSLVDGGVVISSDLERALEPEVLVRLLKQFGLTDADIAQATQTHTRTVRRWKSAAPGTIAAERLGELRNLVLRLRESEGLTDRGIVLWLRHANRLLEDYPPLAVLGVGGFRAVRDAGLRFIDPDRPSAETIPVSVLASLKAADAEEASQVSASPKKRGRAKLTRVA